MEAEQAAPGAASDTYLSFGRTSEGLFKDRGSKFLGFAYPVDSEESVKAQLDVLRKQYHDARHYCYAYILGPQQERYRANDDGEPNHSAGDPILGQLRSHNLTNALVVVVRYFGGTKLGVSGLINAYKTAASEAITANEIVEKVIMKNLSFSFEYPAMNEVMRLVKEYDLEVIHQDFQLSCEMEISVRQRMLEEVREKFLSVENLKLK